MAIKANIVVDQGSDYSTNITLTDDNGDTITLAGYTANAYIRKTYTSTTGTALGTSINATSGILTLSISSTASANLVAGRYVYDVLIKSSANVKSRVVEGIVTVTPRVSK